MDEFRYLLDSSEEEILNTWYALGELTVNKNTKIYTKGSVVRVDASEGDGLSKAPLHNKIIYIQEDYRVDNKTKFIIHWDELSIDDVTGIHAAVQGIQLPYFGVLPAKWTGSFVKDNNFIPYSNIEDNHATSLKAVGGINISDDELETILTVIGFPFANFDDVEFSKEQIIKYMIRPAMQRYFTYRPIIKEEGYGSVGVGSEFLVEFPDNAYGCIPYYCVPGGMGKAGVSPMSPFAFFGERNMAMGQVGTVSNRYGAGLRYRNKMVPGYVGIDSNINMLDGLLASQGMLNVFRREKYSKVKIDGKLYARGFTTIGGNLNIKWLCWSNNWDDIDMDDLEPIARPMARSEVLKDFGMLRSLVKTDLAGQLDPSALKELRNEIEENLKPIITSIGLTGMYSVMRGGGN